jgi:hypothetical protein
LTLISDAPLFTFDPLPFSLDVSAALSVRLAASGKRDE